MTGPPDMPAMPSMPLSDAMFEVTGPPDMPDIPSIPVMPDWAGAGEGAGAGAAGAGGGGALGGSCFPQAVKASAVRLAIIKERFIVTPFLVKLIECR